jgi:hypothetical protein
MEHRHRQAMAKSPTTFYRRAGEMEAFVDVAHASSDMLVWQSAQARNVSLSSFAGAAAASAAMVVGGAAAGVVCRGRVRVRERTFLH